MGKLSLIRVDARLIHGQVAVKWSKIAQASRILVIDDETANNEIMRKILKVAAPANTQVSVLTIQKAVDRYRSGAYENDTCMVVYKNIKGSYESFKKGFPIDKLQLGNCPKKEGDKALGSEVFASQEEIEMLEEMAKSGIKIEIQTIPDRAVISFEKAVAKL